VNDHVALLMGGSPYLQCCYTCVGARSSSVAFTVGKTTRRADARPR
jgi:hypothetical protein